MSKLKVETTIECATCGSSLKRTKTIKVSSQDEFAARAEASETVTKWVASLRGKNCRICQSIIDSL